MLLFRIIRRVGGDTIIKSERKVVRMIKGCAKRVVVVKDGESKLFEEAYFIVRPQHQKNEEDYLGEAEKLLKEGASTPCALPPLTSLESKKVPPPKTAKGKKKHTARWLLPFSLGMLFGAAICFALRLIGVV